MASLINTVLLNTRVETYYGTKEHFAPMIHGSINTTSDAIRTYGERLILVSAYVSSDPKLAKRDVAKYQKRLGRLAEASGYKGTDFVFAGSCKIVANLVRE